MIRKQNAIVLGRLAIKRHSDLDAMVTELTDDKDVKRERLGGPKWNRRFAASGKSFAPQTQG